MIKLLEQHSKGLRDWKVLKVLQESTKDVRNFFPLLNVNTKI